MALEWYPTCHVFVPHWPPIGESGFTPSAQKGGMSNETSPNRSFSCSLNAQKSPHYYHYHTPTWNSVPESNEVKIPFPKYVTKSVHVSTHLRLQFQLQRTSPVDSSWLKTPRKFLVLLIGVLRQSHWMASCECLKQTVYKVLQNLTWWKSNES